MIGGKCTGGSPNTLTPPATKSIVSEAKCSHRPNSRLRPVHPSGKATRLITRCPRKRLCFRPIVARSVTPLSSSCFHRQLKNDAHRRGFRRNPRLPHERAIGHIEQNPPWAAPGSGVAGAEDSKPQWSGARVRTSAGASSTQPQPPKLPTIANSCWIQFVTSAMDATGRATLPTRPSGLPRVTRNSRAGNRTRARSCD